MDVDGSRNREALDLLRAWREGDSRSGQRLAELYSPDVRRFCGSYLGSPSDADDAAQQTFLRMCQYLARLDGVRDFRRWILSVAVNVCRDALAVRSSPRLPDEFEVEDRSEPLDRGVDPDALRTAVGRLPPRYREAVLLRFQMDLPPAEIAEALGLTPGATRVLLHRAVGALRALVKKPS